MLNPTSFVHEPFYLLLGLLVGIPVLGIAYFCMILFSKYSGKETALFSVFIFLLILFTHFILIKMKKKNMIPLGSEDAKSCMLLLKMISYLIKICCAFGIFSMMILFLKANFCP